MAELIHFEVSNLPASKVIGCSVQWQMRGEEPNPIPGLWERMVQDGTLDQLLALPGRLSESQDSVGWMGEYDPATSRFTYIAGILVKPEAEVPEGMDAREIPPCTVAIGQIRGVHATGDLYQNAHQLVAQALQHAGYQEDGHGGFEIEYYQQDRFVGAMQRGEATQVLDYYIPIKPAS